MGVFDSNVQPQARRPPTGHPDGAHPPQPAQPGVGCYTNAIAKRPGLRKWFVKAMPDGELGDRRLGALEELFKEARGVKVLPDSNLQR